MWDPPRPGIESMSPALEDGFFTTEPSGKPSNSFLKNTIFNLSAVAKFKGQCRHFYFLDLILSEEEGNKLPLLPAFLEEWRPCFNHSGSGTQIRRKKKNFQKLMRETVRTKRASLQVKTAVSQSYLCNHVAVHFQTASFTVVINMCSTEPKGFQTQMSYTESGADGRVLVSPGNFLMRFYLEFPDKFN